MAVHEIKKSQLVTEIAIRFLLGTYGILKLF